MGKRIKSILVLLMFYGTILAQDINFSQAYVSSSYLNPALTGLFNGFVRVSTQYREQGRGTLSNKFKTYVVSADIRYKFSSSNKFSKDILAVGLYFVNDRVEVYHFNTNNIELSLAYHKALGFRTKQFIGIGFQGGVIQKNINREHLTFSDMFNKVDAYSFPTSEPILANNFAVGDFSLGIYYTISPNKRTYLGTGIAYQHFSTPNLSFYRNSEDFTSVNNLFPKITYHFSMDYKSASFISVQPRFRFVKQGEFLDAELGSNIKISSFNWDYIALHFGLSAHLIKDLDSYAVGPVVPFFGLQYKNFMMGISYDLVITHLVNTRRNLHTFELSFSYLGEETNEGLVCPKF
jgi:type IX secretion system PorP/SprF family membrane protein